MAASGSSEPPGCGPTGGTERFQALSVLEHPSDLEHSSSWLSQETTHEGGGKGSKGSMVSEALKDPAMCMDAVQLTTYAMRVNKHGPDAALKVNHEYLDWLFDAWGPPRSWTPRPESIGY